MTIISCEGVTKDYGRTKALNNLSFSIEKNKITGLIGRNGAGKTTILKMIVGHHQASSGHLKVFGEEPFNNLLVSANSIFVDDQMVFPSSLNLMSILKVAGSFYENWDEKLAENLLDYFSLSPNQYHDKLSKGMKSTFHMIVGLSARCPLTIFDEPTTGMDAAVRKDFYRALLKDYLAHPRSFIISSHHLNEIEALIEDVLLMKDGKEFLHLPISDLKEYAVSLKGKSVVLQEWLKADKEVIHQEGIGDELTYLVVKNPISDSELQRARQMGLEVAGVSPSDICVYLTSKHRGGIDDVFK